MNVNRVESLRAWQLTYKFKLAVYRLIRASRIGHDRDLRNQIRKSAASAVSQIEEGFARFYPKDNGRMVVGARASLKECLGHLRDAVDLEYITEDTLVEQEALARPALRELAGYLDYLQSERSPLRGGCRRKRGAPRRSHAETAGKQRSPG